ncbi:amidohydrolase family protein [Nonomuraea sp. NPDC000554]|uniref:amidohydrolase family protein n=1 Tax=Nonomuraea sp. NPDC000554 TaxID=3154259 RepID=UPI003327B12A
MHDLLLRDGTVHDGLGGPPRRADVAIADRRVAAVGHDLGPARRVIDVTGLLVSPGFVDPHSHSDTVPFLQEPQPFKLLQGVTTEIVGNCGFSCGPPTRRRGAWCPPNWRRRPSPRSASTWTRRKRPGRATTWPYWPGTTRCAWQRRG